MLVDFNGIHSDNIYLQIYWRYCHNLHVQENAYSIDFIEVDAPIDGTMHMRLEFRVNVLLNCFFFHVSSLIFNSLLF